jgi:hypothetical protein
MTARWRDSVEEHRDTLERLAESDLPLSDDAEQLLAEAGEGS